MYEIKTPGSSIPSPPSYLSKSSRVTLLSHTTVRGVLCFSKTIDSLQFFTHRRSLEHKMIVSGITHSLDHVIMDQLQSICLNE